MRLDIEARKHAESLFQSKLINAVIPARDRKLAKAKFSFGRPRGGLSQEYAIALLEARLQYAEDVAKAQVWAIFQAHQKSRVLFDEDAFRAALAQVRSTLDLNGRAAYRETLGDLDRSGCFLGNRTKRTLEKRADTGLKRIFGDVFDALLAKRDALILASKTSKAAGVA